MYNHRVISDLEYILILERRIRDAKDQLSAMILFGGNKEQQDLEDISVVKNKIDNWGKQIEEIRNNHASND